MNLKTTNKNRNSYKPKFSSALTTFYKIIFPWATTFSSTSLHNCTKVLGVELQLIFNLNEKWSILVILSGMVTLLCWKLTVSFISFSHGCLFNIVVATILSLAINSLRLWQVITILSNIFFRLLFRLSGESNNCSPRNVSA